MGCHTIKNYTLTASQARHWLKLQGKALASATRGCLYLLPLSKESSVQPEQIYHLPAIPENNSHFHQVCSRAEKERKGVVLSFQDAKQKIDTANNCAHIALPLTLDDDFLLVGAFEIHPENKKQLHQSMQKLEWGLRWLKEELLTAATSTSESARTLGTLLRVHTAVQEQANFTDAAQQLVDDLATLLSCERVSIGLYKKRQMNVVAISSQSNVDTTSLLVRDIARAMEECYDQNKQIWYPSPEQHPGPITLLHEVLAAHHGSGSVVSQPLNVGNDATPFILLLEMTSPAPLQGDELQLWKYMGPSIGPILANKRQQEYSLPTIIFRKLKELYRGSGINKRATQSKAVVSLLLLIFCFFAQGDFRVDAGVTLSGTIVRGIVAPFPGYVADANKSAGDRVEQGDVLAALDTSDLTLEELTWTSKYTQADLEYRKAVADNATSQAKIIDQQKKQAEIQLLLLHLQKERAEIKAPFTGLIVTGDLSQSVGGPVERGKLLFEMVPDEGFKILAQVDEKDISFIEKGQTGSLIFNSLPKETFQFSLSKITPVSTTMDGHNSFRVEAALHDTSQRLRPGMKGYAKITVGRKPFIWIWTRTLRDKIRLLGWTLLP